MITTTVAAVASMMNPFSAPHFQPMMNDSATAITVLTMIATFGVLNLGCVRASAFGAMPLRAIA